MLCWGQYSSHLWSQILPLHNYQFHRPQRGSLHHDHSLPPHHHTCCQSCSKSLLHCILFVYLSPKMGKQANIHKGRVKEEVGECSFCYQENDDWYKSFILFIVNYVWLSDVKVHQECVLMVCSIWHASLKSCNTFVFMSRDEMEYNHHNYAF